MFIKPGSASLDWFVTAASAVELASLEMPISQVKNTLQSIHGRESLSFTGHEW
jgi:hypothetical protein